MGWEREEREKVRPENYFLRKGVKLYQGIYIFFLSLIINGPVDDRCQIMQKEGVFNFTASGCCCISQ